MEQGGRLVLTERASAGLDRFAVKNPDKGAFWNPFEREGKCKLRYVHTWHESSQSGGHIAHNSIKTIDVVYYLNGHVICLYQRRMDAHPLVTLDLRLVCVLPLASKKGEERDGLGLLPCCNDALVGCLGRRQMVLLFENAADMRELLNIARFNQMWNFRWAIPPRDQEERKAPATFRCWKNMQCQQDGQPPKYHILEGVQFVKVMDGKVGGKFTKMAGKVENGALTLHRENGKLWKQVSGLVGASFFCVDRWVFGQTGFFSFLDLCTNMLYCSFYRQFRSLSKVFASNFSFY